MIFSHCCPNSAALTTWNLHAVSFRKASVRQVTTKI